MFASTLGLSHDTTSTRVDTSLQHVLHSIVRGVLHSWTEIQLAGGRRWRSVAVRVRGWQVQRAVAAGAVVSAAATTDTPARHERDACLSDTLLDQRCARKFLPSPFPLYCNFILISLYKPQSAL